MHQLVKEGKQRNLRKTKKISTASYETKNP